MRHSSGFTLLELMITVAIVGIIAVGTIPNIIRWRNNQQVAQSARQIYSDLQTAKTEAIKNNRLACVSFDTGNNTYKVFLNRGGDPHKFDANDQLIEQKSLSPGVEMDSAAFHTQGTVATFSRMGFARNFSNADNHGQVEISLAGGGRKSTVSVGVSGNIQCEH